MVGGGRAHRRSLVSNKSFGIGAFGIGAGFNRGWRTEEKEFDNRITTGLERA